jgi:HlyD family secretion protein
MARRRTLSNWWVLAIATAMTGGVWAWRASRAEAPVTFRTARIDRGTVEATVTATGSLNAVVTVQVGSQVSGTIWKLGADWNSKVTEGQVIAQIDPTRFKANVAQQEAALKSATAALLRAQVNEREAKIELDRARELAKRGVIGQADLDTALAKFDAAVADRAAAEAQIGQSRASLASARFDLDHTTIRAPIAGTVLQRSVDVGQTVAASLQAPVLFTIAQDLSRMEVHAAVDEADVGKLHEGQPASFTVDAYPGQIFKAQIFQIRSNPNVQQNVVTYDAVLRVDNQDGRLRPGMTATVRAISQHHDDVLRVANSALRFRPPPEMIEKPAGEGGGKAAPAPAPPGSAMAAEARPPRGAQGQDRPGGGGGGRGGAGAGAGSRVYLAHGNKVVPVRFRPGISDDENTEILGGPLKEGDEVVIDASGGSQKQGSSSSSSSNSTRGRGPRFF